MNKTLLNFYKFNDLIPLFISILIGLLLFNYHSKELKDFKPEEIGVGSNTVVKKAFLDSLNINSSWVYDLENLVSDARKIYSKQKKIVLILGASQLHAINNPNTNSELMIEKLNKLDTNSSRFYIQASIPNANYHELYWIREYFREAGIPIFCTCLSFCYDDLRERPIKPEILNFIKKKFLKINPSNYVKNDILKKSLKEKDSVKKPPSYLLEKFIVSKIENLSSSYKNRGKMIAKNNIYFETKLSKSIVFLSGMKIMANMEGERKFPKINSIDSAWNLKAINAFFDDAIINNEKLFVYYQPVRPHDFIFPYDSSSFLGMKNYLKSCCSSNKSLDFADLTSKIPQKYWGKTNLGYPDIFHFQETGHQILADSLFDKLNNFFKSAI